VSQRSKKGTRSRVALENRNKRRNFRRKPPDGCQEALRPKGGDEGGGLLLGSGKRTTFWKGGAPWTRRARKIDAIDEGREGARLLRKTSGFPTDRQLRPHGAVKANLVILEGVGGLGQKHWGQGQALFKKGTRRKMKR